MPERPRAVASMTTPAAKLARSRLHVQITSWLSARFLSFPSPVSGLYPKKLRNSLSPRHLPRSTFATGGSVGGDQQAAERECWMRHCAAMHPERT